ncbi:ubiquitin-like-conjugating enzyme ATG10 [Lineus longissimus]|uniref:ubiquitin-like-conjugating enzyme ATG10 n=1 Tax=Lineus longissimus TaxID=88925 RepID=UPI002B4F9D69
MAFGCVSQQQFQEEILRIQAFSQQNDSFPWSVRFVPGLQEDGYLCCRRPREWNGDISPDRMDSNIEVPEEVGSQKIVDEDSAALDIPTSETCNYEYHIVYSASYGVPVLYFNACKQDGQLLSLEDIWRNVPQYHQDRLRHEKWTFITQQEHPLLGRPFFQVHPCHTSTLMKQVPEKPRNYVVSWLSVVGPVVGIDVPMSYSEIG